PKHEFVLPELDELARYREGGGGVLLLLDPAPLPNLARFLASMGIRLGDDFVVDREKRVLGTDGLAAVVELFKRGNPVSDPSSHPLESGVVLPSARTVEVAAEAPGVEAESIARTAPSAWAMADPARARRGEEPSQAHHDTPGSASVVVMAEIGNPGDGAGRRRGRMVVVGDSDFASDAYLDLLGNRDLALNAAAWAAGEESLAGTRTKKVPEVIRPLSPLVLTAGQARAIFLAGVVIETVVGLRAVDSFRSRDSASYGLERPHAAIEVVTARGVRRLVIGDLNAAGSAFYARRAGDPRVLQVGSGLLSDLERVFFNRDGPRQRPY